MGGCIMWRESSSGSEVDLVLLVCVAAQVLTSATATMFRQQQQPQRRR
jgi:hypothetical protein